VVTLTVTALTSKHQIHKDWRFLKI